MTERRDQLCNAARFNACVGEARIERIAIEGVCKSIMKRAHALSGSLDGRHEEAVNPTQKIQAVFDDSWILVERPIRTGPGRLASRAGSSGPPIDGGDMARGSSDVVLGTPGRGKDPASRPAKGRKCVAPGCATGLSTYNRSATCYLHTAPMKRHALEGS